MLRNERESGFTLIELLVVIIIIGILAAIAIPTFLNQRKKGWEASAKSTLKNLATAEESYFTDASKYTGTAGDLTTEGFNPSKDIKVLVTFDVNAPTVWSACAQHTSGGRQFTIASSGTGAGAPVAATGDCSGATFTGA